ncbi:MAG: HAD family phosphatase [Burkholderiales bacterium]|uniref:HAD family hydrolase n=1 Tax=Inhella sp. TaxID=1921806 RepID=UPI001AC1B768|nr:HAD family phosphatase [Burkholderiales bacterium]
MSLRVVFDFGAVLFRWRPALVVARAMPHRARTAEQLRHSVRDCFQDYGGDWGQFDLGHIDEQEVLARIHRRTGWSVEELRRLMACVKAELQPQAPVLALLLQLRERGVPLSYLSNMPGSLAEGLERQNPLHVWFESGVFSSRVQLGKPDPAIFALAAQRFEHAPSDCLLIDDNAANIEAARACGWQAERFVGAPALQQALRHRGLIG